MWNWGPPLVAHRKTLICCGRKAGTDENQSQDIGISVVKFQRIVNKFAMQMSRPWLERSSNLRFGMRKKRYLGTLKTDLSEFLDLQKWTTHLFNGLLFLSCLKIMQSPYDKNRHTTTSSPSPLGSFLFPFSSSPIFLQTSASCFQV